MFCICAENSADNTSMFLLMLSSTCTALGPFLLPKLLNQSVGWGTRSWEGTQPGQLAATDQRDFLWHMTSCSAYKGGGRRKKGAVFRMMAFVFPSNCYI